MLLCFVPIRRFASFCAASPASSPSSAPAAPVEANSVVRWVENQKGSEEFGNWFGRAVDGAVFADYYRIIAHPMDLHSVWQKLREGKYTEPDEFAADMRLIWTNCKTYNAPLSLACLVGASFSSSFEAKFAEWLPSLPKVFQVPF